MEIESVIHLLPNMLEEVVLGALFELVQHLLDILALRLLIQSIFLLQLRGLQRGACERPLLGVIHDLAHEPSVTVLPRCDRVLILLQLAHPKPAREGLSELGGTWAC